MCVNFGSGVNSICIGRRVFFCVNSKSQTYQTQIIEYISETENRYSSELSLWKITEVSNKITIMSLKKLRHSTLEYVRLTLVF